MCEKVICLILEHHLELVLQMIRAQLWQLHTSYIDTVILKLYLHHLLHDVKQSCGNNAFAPLHSKLANALFAPLCQHGSITQHYTCAICSQQSQLSGVLPLHIIPHMTELWRECCWLIRMLHCKSSSQAKISDVIEGRGVWLWSFCSLGLYQWRLR